VLSSGANRAWWRCQGQRVAVAQDLVEMRDKRPDRFTVVYRPFDAPNPARGTRGDAGTATGCVPSARPAFRSAAGSFRPRHLS